MRKLTLPLVLLFVACSTVKTGHDNNESKPQANTGVSAARPVQAQGYDAALAARLGADEYGMKNYVLCFLKPGKQRLMMVSELETLDTKHLQYLQQQVDKGLLVMMGMFPDGGEFYEQLVFNTEDTAVANSIMRQDPKVQAEIVVPEFHRWYGPAALPELKPIHERITRKSFEPGNGQ